MCTKFIIGYWVPEKKRQKYNWFEFKNICESEGFILKPIDIYLDLELQGPFHVILHKLSDILARAKYGDHDAKTIISRLEDYIHKHSKVVIIDPLDSFRKLHNRHESYEIIHNGVQLNGVFTPNFVEIKSKNLSENLSQLKKAGIKFPFLCKPLLAHGSSDAHKLMVIFNERGMKDCQVPYVAQDFINHNAILYKVFIIGDRFHVVERPSLKNFYEEDCLSMSTIFFSSQDTCKADSTSKWSILSENDIPLTIKPNYETLGKIGRRIRQLFGLTLAGIDVVVENHSGKYAIIDVNVFPGYDGYPNFFQDLMDTVKILVQEQNSSKQINKHCMLEKYLTDDLDSGFESDEKKKYSKT